MSGFVPRLASRTVAFVSACAVAGVMSFGSATPARAADPVLLKGLAALVAAGVVVKVASKKRKPAKQKYEVIARYCENWKTGLYHRC